MSATQITVAGATLEADLSGALYARDSRTLAVADLHFAKGTAFAAQGAHLPPYDTRTTLERLAAVLARLRPERVICLGDSFHDEEAGARIGADDAASLGDLVAAHDWIWVAGNHDPAPARRFGGCAADSVEIDGLVLRHEADPECRGGELSGHYHPKAVVAVRGRRLRGRCFVFDDRRAILPAFGAYTGGLDVMDPAIGSLFPDGFELLLLGGRRPYRLTRRHLATA